METIRIGFHVSIAGGISNSVDNAQKIGCSAFQIFTRNPRGWAAKPLVPQDVKMFKTKLGASGIDRESVVAHMPYLPNLSGPASDFYDKSVETLAGEIQRCNTLQIPYLVIHLGSHMEKGLRNGITQLARAVLTARSRAERSNRKQHVIVLLENSAGQQNSVGSRFEELRIILDALGADPKGYGVCLDTCHLFTSGYDLRSSEAVEKTLKSFSDSVGEKELRVIHFNDSKAGLNSKLDRHEHIGLGNIGSDGLAAFLSHRMIRKMPVIMETPIDERRRDEQNLQVALAMAKRQ